MADNPVILITRAKPQAERFADELDAATVLKLEQHVIPLIDIDYREIERTGNGYGSVAFSSENAVWATDKLWRGPKRIAFCVGDRTTKIASDLGWEARSAKGNARDLAKLLGREAPQGIVLWPCGKAAGTDFIKAARRRGVSVEAKVVYGMQKTDACDAARDVVSDRPASRGRVIVPVFSPMSAKIAAECLDGLTDQVHVVAISHAAAAAFGAAGQVTVAQEPNGEAMIRSIKAIFPHPAS